MTLLKSDHKIERFIYHPYLIKDMTQTIKLKELENLIKSSNMDLDEGIISSSLAGNIYSIKGVARGVDVNHSSSNSESKISCYIEDENNYARVSIFAPSYIAGNLASSLKTSSETNQPIVLEGLFQGGNIESAEKPSIDFLAYKINFLNHNYVLKKN